MTKRPVVPLVESRKRVFVKKSEALFCVGTKGEARVDDGASRLGQAARPGCRWGERHVNAEGDEHKRDTKRGQQRGNHRQGQAVKHEAHLAINEQGREENDDGGKGGRRHGEADLADPLEAGVAPGQPVHVMALNIFRDHDRVVHQQPDTDDQPENGLRVEAFVSEKHHGRRDEQAQRNGHGDDQRQPELAEEKIENHCGQQGTEHPVVEEAVEANPDDLALVSVELNLITGQRRVLLDLSHGRGDLVAHLHRVSFAFLSDRDCRRCLPVPPLSVVVGIVHLIFQRRNIAEVDRACQGDGPQFLHRVKCAGRLEEIFPAAVAHGAAGQREIIPSQPSREPVDAQSVRLRSVFIDFNLNLLLPYP